MSTAHAAAGSRMPVHVLTGFLGSGKTTLLNRVLGRSALARSAVVVNELGDIGLDHLLVRSSSDAVVELAGGCLCCSVRGELAATLHDLLARRARGACMDFERIIIETTGLADPNPIGNLLVTDAGLAESTALSSVVCTVDAVNGAETLERFPEAVTQAALADRIVLTKTDLAPEAADALARRLRALNAGASLLRAVDGALPAQADPFEAEDPTAAPRRVFAAAPVHGHGEGISTFSLCRDAPVAGAALALFLETLVEHLGADLLRLKGVVRLQESPARPAVVQVAQHVLHPLQLMQRWPQGPGPQTRMVFIVRGDGRDWVERLFDAAAWEAAEVAARLCPRAPGSSMQEDTACSISS